MKQPGYVFVVLLFLLALSGCSCEHDWAEATCYTAKTCSECGETEGVPLNHNWVPASCIAPQTCSLCGTTQGNNTDHTWEEATCQAPETCAVCGQTRGNPIDHFWNPATCSAPLTCAYCAETTGEVLEHRWTSATCEKPEICVLCEKPRGEALGHNWKEASVLTPKTCLRCKQIEGEKLDREDAYPAGTLRYADGRFLMTSDEIVALYLERLAECGYDYSFREFWDDYGWMNYGYQLDNSSGHSIYVSMLLDGDKVFYVSATCETGGTDLSGRDAQRLLDLIFDVCHGSMTEEKWAGIYADSQRGWTDLGQVSVCSCDDLGYIFMDGSGRYEVCVTSDMDFYNSSAASLLK